MFIFCILISFFFFDFLLFYLAFNSIHIINQIFIFQFLYFKMNFKSFLTWRVFGIAVLLILLGLTFTMVWKIHNYDLESTGESDKYSMFMNQYKIERSPQWSKAFDSLSQQKHPQVPFAEKGNNLVIEQKYIAQIGHEGEHYDEPTITDVIDLKTQAKQTKHFMVRSEINQQLFYKSKQPGRAWQNKGYTVLQKCVELDNIGLKQKLHYFIDGSDNFWLLSHPHNNVLMLQVYDCDEKQMVTKIIHEPLHNNRKYMINELIEVKEVEKNLYQVKLLTYESHQYVLKVKSDQWGDNYQIQEVILNPSYEMTSQRISVGSKNEAASTSSSFNFLFIDPLNKIFEQEFNHLVFSTVKDFSQEVRQLLGGLGVDSKTFNAFIRDKLKQYEQEKAPEYLDYDIQLSDENNNCITNLQYHVPSNFSQANSSITRLDKYLLTTKTPVFHGIENYDEHDIVEVLKGEKSPSVSEFKRLQVERGFEKYYTSNNFQSVYHTWPDSRIHFLGMGEKVFYLHPKQNVKDEDYLTIRTKKGGLIMHGTKIKGVYEDRPLGKTAQVHQKYFIEGIQVLPGIYEAHSGYQSLFSILNGSKVQLVNGLSGKTMLNFAINLKQGYQYAGSYLFNNEWWIVQYNTDTKLSELTKHELYLEKSYPKQIDATKRTYGKIIGSEFQDGEDDLAAIFKEYLHSVSTDGVVILDIFRCLDEFYYFQLCDSKGKNYAIARVHYKRLSNRLPKGYQKYSSELEQRLIVQPKDMVKQKQKMDPFLLVLGGRQFFEGIDVLIKQNKFDFKNFSVQSGGSQKVISSIQKMNQFDFLPYVLLSQQDNQGVWTEEPKSTEQILLLNMRVLIENGKKKFMVETRQLARSRVKYFGVFLIVIFSCLVVKLAISKKMKNIQEEKQANQEKEEPKEKGSGKGKNKKEKTK